MHISPTTTAVANEADALEAFARQTVAELAAHRPTSLRALHRHGIDFCCGGGRSVSDACHARGVEPADLLAEVTAAEAVGPGGRDWARAPLPELIDHILLAHHRPLDAELPRLRAMAAKVLRVHGDKLPETLQGIVDTFAAMEAEIEPHMRKEETILFPWIRGGAGARCQGPIAVMEHEHEVLGGLLRRMAALTDHFEPPAGACATWRALYLGLAELDADLRLHIHLENNILFPRALQS